MAFHWSEASLGGGKSLPVHLTKSDPHPESFPSHLPRSRILHTGENTIQHKRSDSNTTSATSPTRTTITIHATASQKSHLAQKKTFLFLSFTFFFKETHLYLLWHDVTLITRMAVLFYLFL